MGIGIGWGWRVGEGLGWGGRWCGVIHAGCVFCGGGCVEWVGGEKVAVEID